ncbi:MAG: hypothetical protein RH860_02755 [Cytophagales bacterium]
MNDYLKKLIERFEKHRNISEAKFQYILDRQKSIENTIVELKDESVDFYEFVAESLKELAKDIT